MLSVLKSLKPSCYRTDHFYGVTLQYAIDCLDYLYLECLLVTLGLLTDLRIPLSCFPICLFVRPSLRPPVPPHGTVPTPQ